MSTMLYKAGGSSKVWGRNLQTKLASDDELDEYLAEGWHKHPHDVIEELQPEDEDSTQKDMGEVSDGYHTFNELYEHRVRLFSTLMHAFPDLSWWSRKHSDGEEWEGWILAGITTPVGEITYHLPESEIEILPEGTELELGKEWDGHTAEDVLTRLFALRHENKGPEPEPEEKPKRVRKPKTDKPQPEVNDEPNNEG